MRLADVLSKPPDTKFVPVDGFMSKKLSVGSQALIKAIKQIKADKKVNVIYVFNGRKNYIKAWQERSEMTLTLFSLPFSRFTLISKLLTYE